MTKTFITVLVFSFLSSIATAQNFTIANEKLNILYIGVDNPLSIVVENVPFQSLIVKTSNGSIEKKDGKFIYRNDSMIGPADVIVYKMNNNKMEEIGRTHFRVKRVTLPVLRIAIPRYSADAKDFFEDR